MKIIVFYIDNYEMFIFIKFVFNDKEELYVLGEMLNLENNK